MLDERVAKTTEALDVFVDVVVLVVCTGNRVGGHCGG